MLRCLAKAPAGRPQSYAELADLLRPYRSAREVAAPLGTRLIAWIADSAIVSVMVWLLVSSAWTVGVTLESAALLLRLSAWSWLASVIYYLVLEGGWGASLGKRLMGLRVTSQTPSESNARWWLRVGLRTVVFHVPTVIYFMGAARGPTVSGLVYTALSLLLTILLFSTARRGNGWTGVHELLSRTRVVQRNVRPVASAAPKASPADLVPALSSLRRVGPYAVHTMVGETGGGRLFVGVDPILRRHVWIHEVPPGTPPVDATRRDVSRPGRLYWLAGRRSATENWDAFEAPRGEPFLTAPPTSDWRQAHRALSSLAIELDASIPKPQSAKPQSTKPGTHGSVSPTCGGERTDNSCSSISRGRRRSRRTPIRLSVLSSCWRRSPLALLLPSLSRPRRCRPQRCCIDLRANRRQRSLMSRRSSCASHRFPVVPRAAVGPCQS